MALSSVGIRVELKAITLLVMVKRWLEGGTRSQNYAHVEMDELNFFNEALLNEEVRELYNMY